jgi:hypothetical protein
MIFNAGQLGIPPDARLHKGNKRQDPSGQIKHLGGGMVSAAD